jgi:NADH:ubiquinone oxidoreductase subunit 3 (subunit A)
MYLLFPPIAFLLYILLVGLLSAAGRYLAGPGDTTEEKTAGYTGGEKLSRHIGAPGYRPFFVVALFFAVLHLGALMIGSSIVTPIALLYIAGLMLALVALILG